MAQWRAAYTHKDKGSHYTQNGSAPLAPFWVTANKLEKVFILS